MKRALEDEEDYNKEPASRRVRFAQLSSLGDCWLLVISFATSKDMANLSMSHREPKALIRTEARMRIEVVCSERGFDLASVAAACAPSSFHEVALHVAHILTEGAPTGWLTADGTHDGDGEDDPVTWRDPLKNEIQAVSVNAQGTTALYAGSITSADQERPAVKFYQGTSFPMTLTFPAQIQQPFTVSIVASGRGDCTLVDSLPSSNDRLEIAYGYPDSETAHALLGPRLLMTASNDGGASRATRSVRAVMDPSAHGNGRLRLITACFRGQESKLFVDGVLVGEGDAGTNPLNGLTIGADRTTSFSQNGLTCELLVWSKELDDFDRRFFHNLMMLTYSIGGNHHAEA